MSEETIQTWEFDDMLDEGKSPLGCKVEWHNGLIGDVVELSPGSFVVEYDWPCEFCGKTDKIYLMSGLHHGALCYVCDEGGNYVANLRDQILVCEDCAFSRKAKNLARKMLENDYQNHS